MREEHVNEIRLRAYGHPVAAPAKDFEKVIAASETDLRNFIDATCESFPEANRRLGLINMCPDRFRTHLRTGGREKFPHYDDLKTEITDLLLERQSRSAGDVRDPDGGVCRIRCRNRLERQEVGKVLRTTNPGHHPQE